MNQHGETQCMRCGTEVQFGKVYCANCVIDLNIERRAKVEAHLTATPEPTTPEETMNQTQNRTCGPCQHCQKTTCVYCDDCGANVCGPCADSGKHPCWTPERAAFDLSALLVTPATPEPTTPEEYDTRQTHCLHCGKVTTYFCDDCQANVCGPCADADQHPCWNERSRNNEAPEDACDNPRAPRVRRSSLCTTILASLTFLAVTTPTLAADVPNVPTGCTIVGITNPHDEGFPLAHCADGSYLYSDLDGSDGALGTEGDGRWLDARGYVLHGV